MSSPHWKAKLRYVRGQAKRASTLWRCFRCAWCSRLRRPKALSNCFCKHALGNPDRGYQVPLVIICAYGMTQSCAGIKYTTACNQAVSPTEEKDVLLLLLSQATQREVLLGLCWPCSDKIGSNDEVAPHCVSTRILQYAIEVDCMDVLPCLQLSRMLQITVCVDKSLKHTLSFRV